MVKSVKSEQKEYVTPTGAARILGVSRPTIYRMMNEGTLPYIEVAGVNKRKISRSDVDRLLRMHGSGQG